MSLCNKSNDLCMSPPLCFFFLKAHRYLIFSFLVVLICKEISAVIVAPTLLKRNLSHIPLSYTLTIITTTIHVALVWATNRQQWEQVLKSVWFIYLFLMCFWKSNLDSMVKSELGWRGEGLITLWVEAKLKGKGCETWGKQSTWGKTRSSCLTRGRCLI